MKKFLIVLVSLGAIFLFQQLKRPSLVVEEEGEKRPLRIMLFNCHYGSGHKMATQSILESLPDCEIQVVDIYNEPLASLDPMRSWFPALSNERIYNEWIKKEQNQLLNLSGKIAPKVLLLQKKRLEGLLNEFISKDKPDLLISCVPLVNAPLLVVAEELDIPFLVVTTDIDVSAFCYGLPEEFEGDRSRFRMTVPYGKTEWNALFGSRFSPSLQASFEYDFGYPTRRAFSETPKKVVLDELRAEYEIEGDEQVVLIMMGGNAGHAAKAYADLFLQMDEEMLDRIVGPGKKIHVVCLCGDISRPENREFMDSLNASERLNRVRIHGCPATSKIGELVSLPELFVVISKPGGSTVNEMIKKRVPMIYHTHKEPLDWEEGNMEYGEARGLGRRFSVSSGVYCDPLKSVNLPTSSCR